MVNSYFLAFFLLNTDIVIFPAYPDNIFHKLKRES